MKKMLLLAGVLALAACGEKKADAPAAETTGEMAPATADTAMAMPADTGMAHSDSMMARDSAH
jgi:predicted small lipoprotein YifL